jgi:hypothetical protein
MIGVIWRRVLGWPRGSAWIGVSNFESKVVRDGTVVAELLRAMATSRTLLDGQGKARGLGVGAGTTAWRASQRPWLTVLDWTVAAGDSPSSVLL